MHTFPPPQEIHQILVSVLRRQWSTYNMCCSVSMLEDLRVKIEFSENLHKIMKIEFQKLKNKEMQRYMSPVNKRVSLILINHE